MIKLVRSLPHSLIDPQIGDAHPPVEVLQRDERRREDIHEQLLTRVNGSCLKI